MFCGALVEKDDDDFQEITEEDSALYEVALNHRNRLLEYDLNSAQRLGVLDEKSDWYDLANNNWLNKEQRDYAS